MQHHYTEEMRYLISTALVISSTMLGAAEPAPTSEAPMVRKPDATVPDTIGILTQHRPTSGDGKPGIFRMQVAGEADLIAIPHADDVITGRADFWFPLLEGTVAIRIGGPVLYHQYSQHTDIGLGDLNLHADWVPQIDGPNGLLVSLDTTWDTANKDRLGINQQTIAPSAAYVIPLPSAFTFAPAIEHRHSWIKGGDDAISFTDVHAYITWLGHPKFWLIADPALNVDHHASRSWFSFDVEGGVQISHLLSVYVRPGFATGDERPYDVHVAGGLSATF